MASVQEVTRNTPSCNSVPAGVCIQLLAARIQNAEASVPRATTTADRRYSQGGTRSRPNSSTPRKVASRKNAVTTS